MFYSSWIIPKRSGRLAKRASDKEDEEHRVWYVGVTRTKQNLYIMAAKKEDKRI